MENYHRTMFPSLSPEEICYRFHLHSPFFNNMLDHPAGGLSLYHISVGCRVSSTIPCTVQGTACGTSFPPAKCHCSLTLDGQGFIIGGTVLTFVCATTHDIMSNLIIAIQQLISITYKTIHRIFHIVNVSCPVITFETTLTL